MNAVGNHTNPDNQANMSMQPHLRFISLFVPDLALAIGRYQRLLQVTPNEDSEVVPAPHPFAAKGPVVFQLGDMALALYECDGHTTHPGDVGFGLETGLDEGVSRLREQGGSVIWGPTPINQSKRRLAIGMLPDRHFFEIVEPASNDDS
jgi:hypothetical protein